MIKEPLDKAAKLNKKNALVNNRIKQSRYHHRHSKLIVLIVDDAVDNIAMIKGIIFIATLTEEKDFEKGVLITALKFFLPFLQRYLFDRLLAYVNLLVHRNNDRD